MKAALFLVVVVVLALVPPSLQYGQVFVDTVNPVKNEFVHITNTHSDTTSVGLFEARSISLADPGGFEAVLPINIDITSEDSLSLNGELGVALGDADTPVVSLNSGHDMTLLSEDFFFSTNSLNFLQETTVDLAAHQQFALNADGYINMDSSLLMALQSVVGDTILTSPEIFATGPTVQAGAEEIFLVDSRTGFVNVHSGEDVEIHSDIVSFRSQQRLEILSDSDFNLRAEDLVRLDAGVAKWSALAGLTIFSNRSVDISSPSLVSTTSDDLQISGANEILISVSEDDRSQLTTFSKDTINLKASGNSFWEADNAHLIASERVVLISNVLNWNAVEDIRIGSEATNHIDFNATNHFLAFSLLEESGDEMYFDASRQMLMTAVNIIRLTGEDLRVVGSTVVGAAKVTNFTANDIRIGSRSEVSVNDNYFRSNGGQFFTIDNDMEIASRRLEVTAPRISLTATDSIEYDAGHFVALGSDGTISVEAANSYLSGGNFEGDASNIFVRAQGLSGKNPDVQFSTLKQADIYAETYSINTSQDISYTSNFGDLKLNIVNDLILTATQELNVFSDGYDSFLIHGGAATFTAQRDILIRNGLVDSFDIASFTFGSDINLEAPVISINSAQKTLSQASRDVVLTSATGVESTSKALKVVTVSPLFDSTVGVNLFAKTDIEINSLSGATTWDSASGLFLFSQTGYSFTTPLLQLDGTEEVSIVGNRNSHFDLLGTFLVDSDGYFIQTAENSWDLTVTTGPLGFTAADSINGTTLSYYDWLSNGDLNISGGYFTGFATEVTLLADNGKVTIAAGATEGSVTLKTHNTAEFDAGDDITFTTGEFSTSNAGLFRITTIGKSSNLAFTAEDSYLELQPIQATISQGYTIQAGDYSYASQEYDAFYRATVNAGLTLQAQDAVYITSDGDLTFNLATSPFVARASNLWQAHSYDSSEFWAGTTLTVTATSAKHIEIDSDGRTGFKARTSDVNIQSASYLDVNAGRIVMDAFASGAIFSAPNQGNINVGSTYGSIRLQSSGTIESTNQDSHIFTSTSGVDFTSDTGLYFYLEGVLEGSNDAIQFRSTDLYGDIVFDSQLSGFTLIALESIDYTAANNISLTSAQGAQFLADTDITWNAPHGSFDVNGAEGIQIFAGEGVDPADVLFNQNLGGFQMVAGEQIRFHSTGVVDQFAITISAVSDIRFATANSGDITFLADGFLDVFANGAITSTATNNLYVESETDSVTITAVTGADFETKGGPIRFTTLTNANGGQINLSATTGDIDLQSGNSSTIFARGAINLNAAAGMSFTSVDGSVEVTAESAGSYINLISAGGIQVRSSGSSRTPEDGIVLRAANNIAFGTPTTKTIQFNAGNDFIVGEVTRPIITFNAGGATGVDGFTINSGGGIYTATENTLTSDIGANLEVSAHFVIGNVAAGPMQLTSGKAMFVNADTGIVELSAATFLKMVSSDSVTGTTAGSLDLVTVGTGPNDQMSWQAPAVSITSGTHQMMGKVLDADLTNSFTLTTSGPGTIRGGLDSESHVLFNAKSSFAASSGNLLSFITLEDQGPIAFVTKNTGSDINITTDVQSDFELQAGGELGVFANTIDWNSDSITFTAIDTVTQSERTDGDIQIGAQSNIAAFSQQDMLLAGARSVLIETVGVNAGVGAPLTITATGDVSLSADGDFLIANTPGEGGNLAFSALTDILIENSDPEAYVNIWSAQDESFVATRDFSAVVQGGIYTTSGDETVIVATGRDSNENYGIKFETTQSPSAEVTFQAIFGSIEFLAGTNVNLNADSRPGAAAHTITVTSDHNGSFRGNTGTTVTAVDDVSVTTKQGRVVLESQTGVEVYAKTTPLQTTPEINFEGRGVDDNGVYSIRFREEGGFPLDINVGTDLLVDANEDISFRAPTITMNSLSSIDFYSYESSLLFHGQTTELFAEVINYNARSIVFESDYFGINAQAGMIYKASSGDLVIETNGLHGNIDLSASAAIVLQSLNANVDIVTARRPNANVNIISSLGRIEFQPTASSNREGFSIDFLAENGDLTFDAQGDDGDVYVDVQSVVIDAAAGLNVQSLYPADPFNPSVLVNIGTTNVIAESDFSFSGDVLNIDSPTVSLLSNLAGADSGLGGSTMGIIEDDIDIAASGSLTISAFSPGSMLVITSQNADIVFDTPIVQISTDAVMKIPYNNNLAPRFEPDLPGGPNVCVDQELFAWDGFVNDPDNIISPVYPPYPTFPFDGDNSWLLICVCVGGNPHCVPFPEPPCDPADTACSAFNFN